MYLRSMTLYSRRSIFFLFPSLNLKTKVSFMVIRNSIQQLSCTFVYTLRNTLLLVGTSVVNLQNSVLWIGNGRQMIIIIISWMLEKNQFRWALCHNSSSNPRWSIFVEASVVLGPSLALINNRLGPWGHSGTTGASSPLPPPRWSPNFQTQKNSQRKIITSHFIISANDVGIIAWRWLWFILHFCPK